MNRPGFQLLIHAMWPAWLFLAVVVFISFGFLVVFWSCRRSQNRTKQPKAAKLGQVLFYFKGHFTGTKQPWLKNLVRCDFGSLIALFFSRKRLFVHFLI